MNVKFITKETTPKESPGSFKDDGYIYLKIKGLSKGQLKRISGIIKTALSDED